jgi:hypothetical protein
MEFFIDLEKGKLNYGKLIRRAVQVRGKEGKVFTRMQWVDPETGQPVSKENNAQQSKVGDKSPKVMPHLPPVREDPPKDLKLNPKHGDIDISKLNRGTKIEETGYLKKRLEKSDMQDYDASPIDVFNGILRGSTVEGVEHVFSDPQGSYRSELLAAFIKMGDASMQIGSDVPVCHLSFTMKDSKGKSMGMMSRRVARKKDGSLAVYNAIFELEQEHMSTGIAKKIYRRSEQYWKHLAQDKPIDMRLTANISIGVYSWAGEGFDFADQYDLNTARDNLKKFCSDNDIDLNEVLKHNNYNNLDELKHSWDFSTLEDDYEYKLEETAPEQYKSDIKGYGHVGKAFMLGGMGSWHGKKILNDGGLSEQIGDISVKYDQRFNKEG